MPEKSKKEEVLETVAAQPIENELLLWRPKTRFKGFARSYRLFNPELTKTALNPDQVAKAYNFPPAAPYITKRHAVIVELGGAYSLPDIVNYCNEKGYPVPQLESIVLPGALEQSSDADGEVALDIEIIAAIAQGSRITVIFCPNTEAGFVAGVQKAYALNPDAISISWGAPETSWTQEGKNALDAAFKSAIEDGIFIGCASGDNGADDGTGSPVADYPACSPYVTACGGTRLELNADGTRGNEVAWSTSLFDGSGSGGGITQSYPVPGYQKDVAAKLNVNNRISPDVAGNADPSTGYQITIDGKPAQVGGTSAVAPLYAALACLINAKHATKCGLWNRAIYANPTVCVDITEGSNGKYKCLPGYDAVTGNGVIDGMKLLNLYQGVAQSTAMEHIVGLRSSLKRLCPAISPGEIDAILVFVCEVGQPLFDEACPIILKNH